MDCTVACRLPWATPSTCGHTVFPLAAAKAVRRNRGRAGLPPVPRAAAHFPFGSTSQRPRASKAPPAWKLKATSPSSLTWGWGQAALRKSVAPRVGRGARVSALLARWCLAGSPPPRQPTPPRRRLQSMQGAYSGTASPSSHEVEKARDQPSRALVFRD